MTTITYPNTSLYVTNGFTGSTISSNSITSPSFVINNINDSDGSTGVSGYVLSSTGNSVKWVPPFVSTATSNLNMNNNNITNINTVTTNTLNTTNITGNTGTVTFSNQVYFTSTPTSITPTLSSELVTKSYADSLSGQTSTSFPYLFFLNFSQTSDISGYKKLSTTMTTSTTQQEVVKTAPSGAGSSIEVARFISDPLGITSIPACFFNVITFGMINSITQVNGYRCTLQLYKNTDGTTPTIAISSISADFDQSSTFTTVRGYLTNFNIKNPYTCSTLDRIIIIVELITVNATGGQIITTYFENLYYSYTTTIINSTFSALPSLPSTFDTITGNLNMNSLTISGTNTSILVPPANTLKLSNNLTSTTLITISPTTLNLGSTINLNVPITLTYTTIPSNTGKIGQVITMAAPTATAFGASPATNTITQTLPYKGIWIASVTLSINGVTAGTITSAALFITNTTTSTLIGKHKVDAPQTMGTGAANYLIMNCNGIIVTTNTSNVITISLSISYTSGTYDIGTAAGGYGVFFTRIA